MVRETSRSEQAVYVAMPRDHVVLDNLVIVALCTITSCVYDVHITSHTYDACMSRTGCIPLTVSRVGEMTNWQMKSFSVRQVTGGQRLSCKRDVSLLCHYILKM